MPQLVPFYSAAKQHREKIATLTWTPGTATTLLTGGALTQIKAYPYLRNILLHVYPTVAGSTGGTLNPDAPWNALASIMIADTNGSAIYGSQVFTGFDAYLTHLLGGYKGGTQDPTLYPLSYSASAASPEFWLRCPLEYNPATGAGSLPNMSANATYALTIIGNTSAAIYQTAPTTTTPTLACDVWMDCWTLPDPVDLLGRNQMQGPPLLGTTQYVTKQTYTGLTASGANNVALTRKGNLLRKWIFVARSSAGARIASAGAVGTGPGGGAYPSPFEFWWDGNRLTSDDPKYLLVKNVEEQRGMLLQSGSLAVWPTGVLCYDFSAPFGSNWGGDGEGGWLATTQSSRLEFLGSNWGSSASILDVLTIDVAPIALGNQYALDSQTGKLLFPAQPEVRGG